MRAYQSDSFLLDEEHELNSRVVTMLIANADIATLERERTDMQHGGLLKCFYMNVDD